MLEPLIVLTVLNCFFMFSSTLTTCALWWQYRSHRCCFKKDAKQMSTGGGLRRSKSSCTCKTTKRSGKSRLDNLVNVFSTSKSATALNRDVKTKKTPKKKSKTNLKYLSHLKNPKDEKSSMGKIDKKTAEKMLHASEASQTHNDAKSAVVMEYSTVQKIVQILDDSDVAVTKRAFKDQNHRQDMEEKERTRYPDIENKPEIQWAIDTPV